METDKVAKSSKLINAGNFIIGLLGWVIAHNLLFILFGVIFELSGPRKGRYAYVISLTIWVVVAIFIRLLVIKRRFWICSGVATTVIVNTLCWVLGWSPSIGENLLLSGLPFPYGLIWLLYG